jgi:hypothetical protein
LAPPAGGGCLGGGGVVGGGGGGGVFRVTLDLQQAAADDLPLQH